MMGQPLPLPPPPIPPPPLPSFLMEEEQPHRGEDYDLLGWARSLSVSPRMFPTYGAPSALENSTFASYKGIGEASPMSSRKELSVGTGLSPMLGPTHIGVSSGAGGGGMLMASGQGDAYDYSSFGQYHTNAPDGTPHHHSLSATLSHSPLRQHSNMSQSQSFSNIAASTRHISPKTISTHQLHHSPPLNSIPRVTPTPLPSSRTMEHNVSLASPLTKGLPGEEEEDPRIRAYAKLEFPTFDIYIQKLSVIVGRRPAVTVAPAAVSPTPGNGLSGTAFDGAGSLPGDVELEKSEVKLEDFFIGMEDDKKQRLDEVDEPKIKMEEPSAAPGFLLTPSSPQAMEAAPEARDFSEFLKSSPPSPVSRTLPLAEGAVNQALEPTFAPEPLEEKPTSEIAVDTARSSSVSAEATPTIASDSLAFDLKPLDVPTPFVDSVGALPLEDSNLLPFDPNHTFASAPPPILTDIDLGPIRAVSRQHARLYFDYELGGWAIEVLGRNGVVVEGTWKAKGEIEILSKRTKIQIAERIFFFVLPSVDSPTNGNTALSAGDDGLSASPGHNSDGDSSSLSELSSDSDGDLSPALSATATSLPDPSRFSLSGADGSIPKSSSVPAIRITSSWADSPVASSSNLSLAPPPRAASKGVVYGEAYALPAPAYSDTSPGKPKAAIGRAKKGKGKAKSTATGKRKVKKVFLEPAIPLPTKKAPPKIEYYDDEEEEYEYYDGPMPTAVGMGKGGKGKGKGKKAPAKMPKKAPKKREDLGPGLPYLPSLPANDSSGTASGYFESDLNQPSGTELPLFSSSSLPSLPGAIGAHPDPNHPSKRGRGRPPKNGVCAQRPRKPKPEGHSAAPPVSLSPARPVQVVPRIIPLDPNVDATPRPAHPYPLFPDPPSAYTVWAPGTRPEDLSEDPMAKPPYTYASLIAQAVSCTPGKKLTLNGIYDWITARWPYFSENQNGWQNSIRHNLTLSRGFLKIPRKPDEVGKGSFWAVDPAQINLFDGVHFRKKVVRAAAATPATRPTLPPTPVPALVAASVPARIASPAVITSAKPAPKAVPKIAIASSATASVVFTVNPSAPASTTAPKLSSSSASATTTASMAAPTRAPGAHPTSATTSANGGPTAVKPKPAPRLPVYGPPNRPQPAKAGVKAAPRPGQPGAPRTNAPTLTAPLPIIVAPIPASYVRPIPPASAAPPDELTAALLKDPPIILHEGRLILNPPIFAHLTKIELDNLQTLPASEALQILQAFVVQHFKDKMRKMALERDRLAQERLAAASAARIAAGGAHPATTAGGVKTGMVARPGVPGAARPAGSALPRPAGVGVAGAKPIGTGVNRPPQARVGIPVKAGGGPKGAVPVKTGVPNRPTGVAKPLVKTGMPARTGPPGQARPNPSTSLTPTPATKPLLSADTAPTSAIAVSNGATTAPQTNTKRKLESTDESDKASKIVKVDGPKAVTGEIKSADVKVPVVVVVEKKV